MSTVAVKRGGPPPPSSSSPSSSTSSSCGSSALASSLQRSILFEDDTKEPEEERDDEPSLARSPSPPPCHLYTEESLQRRLTEALRERDSRWMKHEKAQIQFLQKESSNMLRGLHSEIERLSCRLRESRRLLDVGHCSSEKEMEAALKEKEKQVVELEAALRAKEDKLAEIEQRVTVTVERMSDQINIQADRIRQLNGELQDRTQTVAQLSSQLRAYRLKEAMSLAQARRRVSTTSTNSSSPLVSPSSPHRTFPPFSTYPGSQSTRGTISFMTSSSSSSSTSNHTGGNIVKPSALVLSSSTSISNNIDEKPQRTSIKARRVRSASAFGQPPSGQ